MTYFDPNSASSPDSGIFGLPHGEAESAIVLLPVPWEATTSYGGGTSNGPGAILEASRQVDLFDLDVLRPYEAGIHALKESSEVRSWNERAKAEAQKIIAVGGDIGADKKLLGALESVNRMGADLNEYVRGQTRRLYDAGKIPGVVGGDHSVPYGAIQAAAEKHSSFGILHFDAHSDTRDAFEGFTWSHASIMRNVLRSVAPVTKLVQVGIRDVCEQEIEFCRSQGARVRTFFDAELAARRFRCDAWAKTADEIVSSLPDSVWISFDIDGLDPRFCPHTGTPVPGGLDFQEANWLIGAVARSGRKIIGFDLNEVAPGADDEWDANVGARLLYKICAWTLLSQGKAKAAPAYSAPR